MNYHSAEFVLIIYLNKSEACKDKVYKVKFNNIL